MLHTLFSFSGRIGRARFWAGLFTTLSLILLSLAVIGLSMSVWRFGSLTGMTPADAIAIVINTATSGQLKTPAVVVNILAIGPLAAITAKRLRDHGEPAWPSVFVVVTLQRAMYSQSTVDTWLLRAILSVIAATASLWVIVYLGCMRGTVGPNQYGPDPLQPKTDWALSVEAHAA